MALTAAAAMPALAAAALATLSATSRNRQHSSFLSFIRASTSIICQTTITADGLHNDFDTIIPYSAMFFTLKIMLKYSLHTIHGR
jgi:hypothetical protein